MDHQEQYRPSEALRCEKMEWIQDLITMNSQVNILAFCLFGYPRESSNRLQEVWKSREKNLFIDFPWIEFYFNFFLFSFVRIEARVFWMFLSVAHAGVVRPQSSSKLLRERGLPTATCFTRQRMQMESWHGKRSNAGCTELFSSTSNEALERRGNCFSVQERSHRSTSGWFLRGLSDCEFFFEDMTHCDTLPLDILLAFSSSNTTKTPQKGARFFFRQRSSSGFSFRECRSFKGKRLMPTSRTFCISSMNVLRNWKRLWPWHV